MSDDLFVQGWDKWLRKGEQIGATTPNLTSDSSVPTGGGGSADNPISNEVTTENISSGEIGSLLGYGKKTFTDSKAGILFGLDSDGVYKWYIGSSTNSADWAVTTPNTLTIKGTIIASNDTTDEYVIISSGSVAGYGPDGVSIIWRFLQEPTYNNVMTIWKRDFTPSYGNALSIFEYSTDVNHTFDITTNSGAGTGNTSKCLMSLFANCDKLLNNLQLIGTLTDQSTMIYAIKNSGDLDKAMIHLKNDVNDGEGICIDQNGTTNPNTALLVNNFGTAYGLYNININTTDETEYAMIKWDVAANTNTGRWALERVDHCTDKFCMKLGAYYIWVDSAGDIRIKSGRPAADNDGEKIADQ